MATVIHYLDHWLPVSAGFVHDLVTRSAHRAVVLARSPLENADAFPHRPVRSLAPLVSRSPARAKRRAQALGLELVARAYRADIVHVHFGYSARDVLGVVRRRHLAYVLSLHGHDATAFARADPGFFDPVIEVVDAVAVPSRFLADVAVELGFPRGSVHVLPSGVDTGHFTALPLPTGDPTVAFVGRLVEKKGIDVLARAWPEVRARVPNARLTVLGDGPLARVLGEAGGGVAHLTPDPARRRAQVRDLLHAATVVATPSRTGPEGDAESLLLVNLEAQACGRPVVTTRHGGIPEYVVEDRTALLVDEGDHEGLADALVRVLTDHDLAARLGAAGPPHASRWDWRRCARAFDDLYDGLVRGRRGRDAPASAR